MSREEFVQKFAEKLKTIGFQQEEKETWCLVVSLPPKQHVFDMNGQVQRFESQTPPVKIQVSLVGEGSVDSVPTVQVQFTVAAASNISENNSYEEAFYLDKKGLEQLLVTLKTILYQIK